MRQIFLFFSVLLLGLSWAVAQSTTPSTSSPSSGQASQGSETSGQTSASGGEKSVVGCLSGSGGTYTLTDKSGMTYQLTGDTAKLSEHVGHEVRITGTPSSPEAGTQSGTTAGGAGSQTLQVSSVKHISKSCKSDTGGMSH
jgi:hypothetical protein